MNIVIIGYRGTGKTEVAKQLANDLNMKSFSMDAEVVKRAGMTIPEIVERYGWDKFRHMETEVAAQMSKLDNIIVDTGGGVIERPENIIALGKNALIFWLRASVDIIVKRIESGAERPALTSGKSFTEEVAEVLTRRIPKYADAADYEINTDEKDPAKVADEIILIWRKHMK